MSLVGVIPWNRHRIQRTIRRHPIREQNPRSRPKWTWCTRWSTSNRRHKTLHLIQAHLERPCRRPAPRVPMESCFIFPSDSLSSYCLPGPYKMECDELVHGRRARSRTGPAAVGSVVGQSHHSRPKRKTFWRVWRQEILRPPMKFSVNPITGSAERGAPQKQTSSSMRL